MAWAVPQHTREQVNSAGKKFLSRDCGAAEYIDALGVINNWRASHAFLPNTFQMNLRKKGKALDDNCLVAQRIKRLSSIQHKPERFAKMKLSQMQDLGGCRAIVKDVATVRRLVDSFQSSEIKHRLASKDDYIETPKASGYRGIHLVYRYYSDRRTTYNDQKIELQIRSQLQHSWATAVEVVGTLIRQALKSSQGEEDWLRFFQLMGSALALEEHCVPVPNTPLTRDALRSEIRALAKSLRPIDRLNQYSQMIQVVENSATKAKYYLLDLRASEGTLRVTGYKEAQSEQASNDSLEVERSLKGEQGDEAVQVSIDSIDALRRAYPNYFLDTGVFLTAVRRWIK